MSVEVAWFLGLLLVSLLLVWHASAIERLEKQVRHLNALADTFEDQSRALYAALKHVANWHRDGGRIGTGHRW